MSKALDIINAVRTTLDSDQAVVTTIEADYRSLADLNRLADHESSTFPRAFVFAGDNEVEAPEDQVVGTTKRYDLPLVVDCYVLKDTNLVTERENAIKALRDIIELPANQAWTSDVVKTEPKLTVRRAIPWQTPAKVFIIGAFSIQWNVTYKYAKGAS